MHTESVHDWSNCEITLLINIAQFYVESVWKVIYFEMELETNISDTHHNVLFKCKKSILIYYHDYIDLDSYIFMHFNCWLFRHSHGTYGFVTLS